MNDEKIRDLLFGKKAKSVPIQTIVSYRERGLLPNAYSEQAIHAWKYTFIGNFITNYPERKFVIMSISDAIGKLPKVSDFTEANLLKIVEKLKEKAPNTARQMASQIKSTLNRLMESDECKVAVPCKRYAKLLSLEGCPTTKTYMTIDDLKKFLKYEPENDRETTCKALFAIMMMTGARYSDVLKFKRANVQNGVLTYVPQKTKSSGTVVSIPVSEQIAEFIGVVEKSKCCWKSYYFNRILKGICEKCGLDEEVTYFWGGKYVTKPKYEAMRSHLGRASFVTNMLKLGQQMHEVSKMAGHTDIAMTSRYNASTDVKLTKEADDFINMKF